MSTELVQVTGGDNQVAGYGLGAVNMMGGLDTVVRLKPTSITLVQPTTRDPKDAKQGQFLDVLSGVGYDKIRGALLAVRRGRKMYPQGADLDTPPTCFSVDGNKPHPDAKIKQASECSKCKQSRWIDRKKPPCAENLKLLIVAVNEGLLDLPRIVKVSGVSISPVKQTLETIQTDMYQRAKRGEQPAVFEYIIELGSVKKAGSKGSYYQILPAPPKRAKDPTEYAAMYQQFVLNAAANFEDDDTDDIPEETISNGGESHVVEAEIVEEV